MKNRAVVFDFDGTLLDTGPDKGVHAIYSVWAACLSHGFKTFLHPDDPGSDVEKMLKAYAGYPGAPRFEQLSAVINALVNDRYEAVADPADLGLDRELSACYEPIKREYNALYSGLNDTAARSYWRPFHSAKETVAQLEKNYDLYIASGVVQELLDIDFNHHKFDRELFRGIFGSDDSGTRNKGVVLNEIKRDGYQDILFVGDSTKDQEYAIHAGVRFLRIISDADFERLLSPGPFALADEKVPWSYSAKELEFFQVKTTHILRALSSGNPLKNEEICGWINSL
ncbi:MAG: HAD family hydrolase [Spirochaetales bacterium]|jgi:phosphoglycolate phosphatase-like HAD superfamily hydrolase|nr:HAD family hydrolase [Spirochaetales bacterium]